MPYRYVGQTLEAHVHEQVAQLYDQCDLVSTHPRCSAPGQFQTRMEHYPEDKAAYLTKTQRVCRGQATRIGPATFRVVDQLFNERPLDRLRSVQGLLRLEDTVGAQRLEAACARALHYGQASYRQIKEILNTGLDFKPLPETEGVITPERFTFAREAVELFSLPKEVRR